MSYNISGLFTGHIALNGLLTVMKIYSDPVCPAYENDETLYQFLGRCCTCVLDIYLMAHDEQGEVM